jgi:hypothetical protein
MMKSTIACKTLFLVLALGALYVAADESISAEHPINNYADLNAATAALKHRPSHKGNFSATPLSKVLKMLIMAVVTFVMAWVLTNQGEAILQYLRASVAPVAAHLLVYALSGPSRVQDLRMVSKKTAEKTAERKTFSLDMRLDIAHLPDGVARRRFSQGLENRLMPATLEQPSSAHLQSKTTPTASPTIRSRSSTRRYGEMMSPSLGGRRLPVPMSPDMLDITRHDAIGRGHSSEQPARRRPGSKPNFKRLQDQNLAQAPFQATRVQEDMEALLDSDSEWDSDWEDEPRAPAMPRGEEMEGYDVGIIPQRVLRLSQPAVPYVAIGLYGRSILTSTHQMPKMS